MESNSRPATDAGEKLKQAAKKDEVVRNPNPKSNENIRVRTEQPETKRNQQADTAGSEITDGEDG